VKISHPLEDDHRLVLILGLATLATIAHLGSARHFPWILRLDNIKQLRVKASQNTSKYIQYMAVGNVHPNPIYTWEGNGSTPEYDKDIQRLCIKPTKTGYVFFANRNQPI